MKTIQKIFVEHRQAYLERFGERMPEAHKKTLDAVCGCRSGECGTHLFACPECGETHLANSSCGNRHCPVCQDEKAANWVYKQQLSLLPCTYFLATFTLPEELNELIRSQQKELYNALLDQAAASLQALESDPRFIGCASPGFFGVLHTWGRQMQYHPHAHFVIAGGGLTADRAQWRNAKGNFLVHVRALSALFKGKMRSRFDALGMLESVPADIWQKDWVVHCEAVGNGASALKYLGAYVFRVGISDSRIVSYDGDEVKFRYQKVGSSKWRFCSVSAQEFIRRFLQHTLPKGFVKIRHYGFLSPNFSTSIERIRELICVLYETLRGKLPKPEAPRKSKPLLCPECRNVMRWVRFVRPFRIVIAT